MELAKSSYYGHIKYQISDNLDIFWCSHNSITSIDLQGYCGFIDSQLNNTGHLSVHDLIANKIGLHAKERLRTFENYSDGWEGEVEKPLNPKSTEMLYIFLKSYSFLI